MSYNIRNIEGGDSLWNDPLTFEYTNRDLYVLNAIKAENPDVLGLQEACIKKHAHRDNFIFTGTKTLSWFSTLEGTNGLTNNGYTAYRGLSPQGAGSDKEMFNAIYYKTNKFNFVDGGTEIITGGTTDKCANWVVLDTKAGGQRFIFISAHFQASDTGAPARIINAEKLLALVDRLTETHNCPVILVGDFNESLTSNACKMLVASGLNDTIAAAKTKVNETSGSYVSGSFTTLETYKWDHIFTKGLPQYAYISYYETVDNKNITGSVGKYPSDHLPAIAYVEFPIIH